LAPKGPLPISRSSWWAERAMDPTPIPVDVRSEGGRVLSFAPRRM
jgi:hypothetical protein